MCERAEATYLQDKILRARKIERQGILVSIFGTALTVFSFLIPFMIRLAFGSPTIILFFVGLLGGVFIVILGLAIGIYYAVEGGVLMKQQSQSECFSDLL